MHVRAPRRMCCPFKAPTAFLLLAITVGACTADSTARRPFDVDTLSVQLQDDPTLSRMVGDSVGGIRTIIPLGTNHILIADYLRPTVWDVDLGRDRMRRMVRTGPGPGEVGSVDFVGLLDGGIWVWDFARRTLHRLAVDFESMNPSRTVEPDSIATFIWPAEVLWVLRNGSFVGRPDPYECLGTALPLCDFAIFSWAEGGLERVTTLFRSRTQFGRLSAPRPGYHVWFQPFPVDPIVDVDETGSYIATLTPLLGPDTAQIARFRVALRDATGTILWDASPVWTTEGTRDVSLDSAIADVRESDRYARVEDPEDLANGINRPRVVPPFVDLRVTANGRVWLLENPFLGSPNSWYSPTHCDDRWELARLPADAELHAVAGRTMWAEIKSSTGIPRIARLDLETSRANCTPEG